jgi:hypothetical protein
MSLKTDAVPINTPVNPPPLPAAGSSPGYVTLYAKPPYQPPAYLKTITVVGNLGPGQAPSGVVSPGTAAVHPGSAVVCLNAVDYDAFRKFVLSCVGTFTIWIVYDDQTNLVCGFESFATFMVDAIKNDLDRIENQLEHGTLVTEVGVLAASVKELVDVIRAQMDPVAGQRAKSDVAPKKTG